MPTVSTKGSYRLFFYSGDSGEPPQILVEREHMKAKFWLGPVRLHKASVTEDSLRVDLVDGRTISVPLAW